MQWRKKEKTRERERFLTLACNWNLEMMNPKVLFVFSAGKPLLLQATSADICRRRGGPNVCTLQEKDCLVPRLRPYLSPHRFSSSYSPFAASSTPHHHQHKYNLSPFAQFHSLYPSFSTRPRFENPQQLPHSDSQNNLCQEAVCPWAGKALSIAQHVLLHSAARIQIFSFKFSPRGYIYVTLDTISDEFLSMEDIQRYSHKYKKKLEQAAAIGDIPNDLALEVSSIGADRVLKIPHDLQRFKNKAMRVKYAADPPNSMRKQGIFCLETIEMDSEVCVWRLADVKENRPQSCKGRPLTRKQKDWRLKLSCEMLEHVTLYVS